ncbi:MAG TPA: hypothetical protein VEK57_06960 [Thermoanaerobaculia bacterium]|nr:hypothetical protein [Thermoanaerobaculia bacterium]
MDQNNPNNSGFGTGTIGSTTGSGSTGSGSGFNTGGTGSGMSSGGGMSSTGSGSGTGDFGVTSGSDLGSTGTGSDAGICAHCGQSLNRAGLDQFLSRLGINEDMLNNLKGQFQNVDIDEYLNTARDYLKDSGGKAQTYAKENPGKVAAGVAALALGAGLIYAAVNRDKS